MKRPAFQFYPGDWKRDAALQSCSLTARGLWIEMLCIMHDASPYGHLRVGNKGITDTQLARMAGAGSEAIEALRELEEAGVFSRTKDGTIYSRRLVKDHKLSLTRSRNGSKGGNPKLLQEVKPPLNHSVAEAEEDAIADQSEWDKSMSWDESVALWQSRIGAERLDGILREHIDKAPAYIEQCVQTAERRVAYGSRPIDGIAANEESEADRWARLEPVADGWIGANGKPEASSDQLAFYESTGLTWDLYLAFKREYEVSA